MITANKITRAAYLNTQQLEQLIQESYRDDTFVSSHFLGITNGGEFAYQVTYIHDGAEAQTKVFVSFDQHNQLQADY